MTEKNSLSKRVGRYASVSGSVAMAGVKILAQVEPDHKARAAVLRLALGGLKGPLMKVAQILGTIPDLVPPEYTAAFAQLQSDAPSMGWPFVKRRMKSELGSSWQDKFTSFDQTASAAASLGQVHKAISLQGQALACKLQYPDMDSVVEADLAQLKIILALYEKFDRAVSTNEVQVELAERLREELDYVREAKHLRAFGKMLSNVDGVFVPQVITELSTPRLLTMSWLEGEKLSQVAEKRSLEDRNRVAINLHRAWYRPFYDYGVIHGDPHMGNYTVRPDNGINLMDFGCVRIFKPSLVDGVITLYKALLSKDAELAVEAYKAWGFVNPSKRLVEILNLWSQFIYAPLLEDRLRPLSETNTGVYGKETAAKVHAELRKIGGVTVPREFVFMDRAAVGLGSVFLRLRTEVNWYRVFNDLIHDFDLRRVERQQSDLLLSQNLL